MKTTYWDVLIDVGFWTVLAKKKLDIYKLSSQDKPLFAKYRLAHMPDKMASLSIDAFSYQQQVVAEKIGPVEIQLPGKFLNTNTIEEFKAVDPEEEERKLYEKELANLRSILDGKPGVVVPTFKMFTFADLKKHIFWHLFLSASVGVSGHKELALEQANVVFKDQLKELNKVFKEVIRADQLSTFFVVKVKEGHFTLSSVAEFVGNKEEGVEFVFGTIDTVNYAGTTGFHTYSVLALFALLRKEGKIDDNKLKKVRLLLFKDFMFYNLQKDSSFKNTQLWTLDLSEVVLQGKLTQPRKPTQLDLKSFMDERSLAKQAVDLNIKLMKWRLLPTLDIPKIQSKKCLLFGAGTLGCQLARNLIGWGIKYISFVDYSKVSYSNPVRQTLYEYEDTIKGGKPKAQTAAEKLKKIYPEIVSQGYHLSVPMPGHYVTTKEMIQETFKNLDILEKLVQQHDVLFLLLDSRQARWLPTVLANKYDKACITVGLGFDSFVIVRHGISPNLYNKQTHHQRLSCYFCNDIVTPQDTMKDRTLDQMCTVTRPGLSFTSAAYASQLYISLIHHPLQHHVWANEDSNKLETTDLGKLPHHLRGCMSEFEVSIFYGRAFEQCVACSKFVLDQYVNNREEFMLTVLNDPSYIHKVTNLADELKRMEDQVGLCFDVIEDEEEIESILREREKEKGEGDKGQGQGSNDQHKQPDNKQAEPSKQQAEQKKQQEVSANDNPSQSPSSTLTATCSPLASQSPPTQPN